MEQRQPNSPFQKEDSKLENCYKGVALLIVTGYLILG